jgi:hypothetical protein
MAYAMVNVDGHPQSKPEKKRGSSYCAISCVTTTDDRIATLPSNRIPIGCPTYRPPSLCLMMR